MPPIAGLIPLMHVTAAYSNAVMVAVMPYVADCAKALNLPVPQPITTNQLAHIGIDPYKGHFGAGLKFTNDYFFTFENGIVTSFRCPDDYFTMADENWDHLERYVGKDNMTTNDAVQLARDSFRNLGYKPEDFGVDGPPTGCQGPFDNKRWGHIPYCRVAWERQPVENQVEIDRSFSVYFDINLQTKQVTAMWRSGRQFWKPNPKIDIVLEPEADYRKRTQLQMFVRTNAPPLAGPKIKRE
ncbi:MAG: hypothetical protein ACLQAH_08100 [Limisphaerales bacterium]